MNIVNNSTPKVLESNIRCKNKLKWIASNVNILMVKEKKLEWRLQHSQFVYKFDRISTGGGIMYYVAEYIQLKRRSVELWPMRTWSNCRIWVKNLSSSFDYCKRIMKKNHPHFKNFVIVRCFVITRSLFVIARC